MCNSRGCVPARFCVCATRVCFAGAFCALQFARELLLTHEALHTGAHMRVSCARLKQKNCLKIAILICTIRIKAVPLRRKSRIYVP